MHPQFQVVTVVPQFDPNSARYRCWFGGCCRITTCAKVIGFIELISVLIHFIAAIVQYAQWNGVTRRTELIFGVITFLVAITVIILLFYGIIKERAVYLIPHLVMQIISLLLLAVGVVLFGVAVSAVAAGSATSNDDQYGGGQWAVAVYIVLMIVLLIAFFLQILFFINILRCYRFLKDKAIAERIAAEAALQQQQQQGHIASVHQGGQNQVYEGEQQQYNGSPV